MVQGTSSGVGKSIISIALCRIFKQNGFSVAPFKVQNMSSNFHVLENGYKMARSQAIAAYACCIDPSVYMNPILIIPNEEGRSETILEGKSIGVINSNNYDKFRDHVYSRAVESFKRLSKSYDIIVVEGSGSPVEMNLIKNDIANMKFAEEVNSPVILIGDINRGGVFSSLYGTMMLFTQKQRDLVKGIIVNKFIGDSLTFNEGKNIIEDLCKLPVLGVIPYTDIKIEDEDSLADFGRTLKTKESLGLEFKNNYDDESYFMFMDREFDRIADHVRNHLDIKQINEILNIGNPYE